MKSLFTHITVIMFLIAALTYGFTCIGDHTTDPKVWAEGNHCPYEGAECPNAQAVMHDYQIDIHMDTLWLYDGDRLVGRVIDPNGTYGAGLDVLITEDNL